MGSNSYAYLRGGTGSDPSLAARVTVLENNLYEIEYWESVSAASGAVTPPTGATIRLDQFQSGADAYVSTIFNGQPSGVLPVTSGDVSITVTSFDASGNYVLSGTPSAYPVAIIYVFSIAAINLSNLALNNVLNQDATVTGNGVAGEVAVWITTNNLESSPLKTIGGQSLFGSGDIPVADDAYNAGGELHLYNNFL